MGQHTFFCIDGHTCGNPVRIVAAGAPALPGADMSARRQYFLEHFDWVRTGLMFEPRGHDMMSGAILYPPTLHQRAGAARRRHERSPPILPGAFRLGSHRADVRAARPRHDVGRHPLPADARRLRRGGAVHRDHRLPADVRARDDRHGHDRHRTGIGHARDRRGAAPGHAGGAGRCPLLPRRRACGLGTLHQRRQLRRRKRR